MCDELSALVMVEDDGSQNCGENRFWPKTGTSHADCNSIYDTSTAQAQSAFAYVEWRSSCNAGSGACFASPYGSANGYDLWSNGIDALAKLKTPSSNLGGAYCVGQQYIEGKMSDATKC